MNELVRRGVTHGPREGLERPKGRAGALNRGRVKMTRPAGFRHGAQRGARAIISGCDSTLVVPVDRFQGAIEAR